MFLVYQMIYLKIILLNINKLLKYLIIILINKGFFCIKKYSKFLNISKNDLKAFVGIHNVCRFVWQWQDMFGLLNLLIYLTYFCTLYISNVTFYTLIM